LRLEVGGQRGKVEVEEEKVLQFCGVAVLQCCG
jgi:hypothetical protein